MGYTTDFVGHIDIEPPLNDAEIEYLLAFSASRRFARETPYDVPGNPRAETSAGVEPARYNRPPKGQPDLWCDWQVCWDGCCMSWSGNEKSYAMVEWLRYVIDHFLRPGALAASDARFTGFTFDHTVTGTVVGCRRDNKELFLIRAADNVVTQEVITPADPKYLDYPPLPYEEKIDRDEARMSRRRRPLPGEEAKVVELVPREV